MRRADAYSDSNTHGDTYTPTAYTYPYTAYARVILRASGSVCYRAERITNQIRWKPTVSQPSIPNRRCAGSSECSR
jgi:hypothetical protein